MTRILPTALLASAVLASSALAQHDGDIGIVVDGGVLATVRFGSSGASADSVFGATFGDTGVARFTSNPGFEALPGTFAPGTRTGFNLLAGLERFTGAATEPIEDERIEAKFLTLLTVLGGEPTSGFDLAVASNGSFHRHLSFTLTTAGAKLPSSGIYVAQLELYSTDGVTGPSAPFWIVFNDGRALLEHEAAIAWVRENLADGATPCPADLDSDGVVGATDLAALLGAWASPAADLDGDGTTGATDLAALLAAWGACP